MTDVVGSQVSVNAEKELVAPISSSQILTIANQDATISVFLGPAGVTVSGGTGGFELKAGKQWGPWSIPPETTIHALPASGSPRVDVFRVVAD